MSFLKTSWLFLLLTMSSSYADDTWAPVPIGGGGFITGMDMSLNGIVIAARTDVYGAYVYDRNTATWRQVVTHNSGLLMYDNYPETGRGVLDIKVGPTNHWDLIMAFHGKVYRSASFGYGWTPAKLSSSCNVNTTNLYTYNDSMNLANNGETRLYNNRIAIDPNNNQYVLFGDYFNGLRESSDGANCFISNTMSGLPATGQVYGIAFDPRPLQSGQSKTQMILAVFRNSTGSHIYRTMNGGSSWSLVTSVEQIMQTAIAHDGTYFFTAISNGAHKIFELPVGATSANDITLLLPTPNGPYNPRFASLAVSSRIENGQTKIWLAVADQSGRIAQRVGNTWMGMNSRVNITSDTTSGLNEKIDWLEADNTGDLSVGAIVFDKDSGKYGDLWMGMGKGVINTQLAPDGDWQMHFKIRSKGIEELVANRVIATDQNEVPVLTASMDFNIFPITSFSTTSYSNLPAILGDQTGTVFASAWDIDSPNDDPKFFVTIASNQNWPFEDFSSYWDHQLLKWMRLNIPDAFKDDGANRKDVRGAIAAVSNQNFVWVGDGARGAYYTLNRGDTWSAVQLPDTTDWLPVIRHQWSFGQPIAADRGLSAVDKQRFYLYHKVNGMYVSENGGQSWQRRSNDTYGSDTDYQCHSPIVKAMPNVGGLVFITPGTDCPGKYFYFSLNAGSNWYEISNMKEVSAFGFGKHPSLGNSFSRVYVAGKKYNSDSNSWESGVWFSDNITSLANQQGLPTWYRSTNYPLSSIDLVKTMDGDKRQVGKVYVGFGGSGFSFGQN